ncbi:MAG: bifunctional (p)ppGpp synthetase/guanosine-3',5'-bis(diphosphate) 3'-pyrophosphohydrolase [Candidatus Marinimicrobia bacterium]|nr:bifunctional (p)ppGpp synthetase/guanosine-3',5'-bis(diphosphate) 3'-pyrophosphohydrolase [Candidatus Neomarinimicrobiota bacterium]
MSEELLENVSVDEEEVRPKKFYSLLEIRGKGTQVTKEQEEFLWKVYKYAREAHRGQKRKSGEPYFEHPYQVALILSEMNMDVITVASGMLHDVIEDTNISFQEIAEIIHPEVAQLVEGVTKISGIKFKTHEDKQADNFRKMLLNVARDIRVLIIKFADRLHNMRTIGSLNKMKQRRIALETQEIYAPLAHRLGMYKLRAELEDLILKTLDYEAYRFLKKKVRESKDSRDNYIKVFSEPLKKELAKQNISAVIKGRSKHFYSIYRKMKIRNKPFEEIYDLLAIRVIVDTVEQCYAVLGSVHKIFTPVMERFKDYIASHKANYYQSLHTTVYGPGGKVVEIQIRTREMDHIAEEGIAAHWKYKEGKSNDIDKYVVWLRDLVEMLKTDSINSREFMEALKIDLFKDEIFVFTPMGDLVRLPVGSTPIDFAFEIHTEVGYGCIGAKVDGKMVSLNTQLKSGQKIEIITSDAKKPSYAWLKIAKTSKALTAIKKWIKNNQKQDSIQLGREILEKENRKNRTLHFLAEVEKRFAELGYDNLDNLLADVGEGELSTNRLHEKLFAAEEEQQPEGFLTASLNRLTRRTNHGIKVHGVKNMMIKFAQCCHPIPGDPIIGFISRGRGVIIHTNDCNNIPALVGKNERLIDVEWDVDKQQIFASNIKITGQERRNLLADITKITSETNTNIIQIEGNVDDTINHINLVIEVSNLRHLDKVISKLRRLQGIISVERK